MLPEVYQGYTTPPLRTTDMRAAIFTLAMLLLASPASAACVLSHCKADTSTRSYIVNNSRQIVGDLYSPSGGGRVQIRTNQRVIVGFIERDGTITNTRRQKVGTIEALQ